MIMTSRHLSEYEQTRAQITVLSEALQETIDFEEKRALMNLIGELENNLLYDSRGLHSRRKNP